MGRKLVLPLFLVSVMSLCGLLVLEEENPSPTVLTLFALSVAASVATFVLWRSDA